MATLSCIGAPSSRLPIAIGCRAIYWNRPFVDDGGLMSYAADNLDLWRRAAVYVDRILNGARPADLPVQQPTKFELAINGKGSGLYPCQVAARDGRRGDRMSPLLADFVVKGWCDRRLEMSAACASVDRLAVSLWVLCI
jgi:ABC transporter substrate binding protein